MKFGSIGLAGLALFVCAADLRAADEREKYDTSYAEMDGELVFMFDRDRRSFRLYSSPGISTRAEQISGEYPDCSTAALVCFDFDEFMLAVPKSGSGTIWSQGQWRFRRSACLGGPEGDCKRYSVIFSNEAEGYDGGFVFSGHAGVEMFYHSSRRSKRKPIIFVLQEGKGLLSDGRP